MNIKIKYLFLSIPIALFIFFASFIFVPLNNIAKGLDKVNDDIFFNMMTKEEGVELQNKKENFIKAVIPDKNMIIRQKPGYVDKTNIVDPKDVDTPLAR